MITELVIATLFILWEVLDWGILMSEINYNRVEGYKIFRAVVLGTLRNYEIIQDPHAPQTITEVHVMLTRRDDPSETRYLHGYYNLRVGIFEWKAYLIPDHAIHKIDVYGAAAEIKLSLYDRIARPEFSTVTVFTMDKCPECGYWMNTDYSQSMQRKGVTKYCLREKDHNENKQGE